MGEFAGKVALITGGSSGIGRATAVLLVSKGAKVAIVGRNTERLEETKKLCIEKSNIANANVQNLVHIIVADLAEFDVLERIVKETVKVFGGIDVLVNNAGEGQTQSITESTLESYNASMDINFRAPLFLIKYSAPYLAERRGSIVNVSSIACLRGQASFVMYAASKAALDQLTRSACVEFGAHGIRVNSVSPGITETMFHSRLGMEKSLESAKKLYANTVPVQHHGQPEHIAECIAFLASSKSAFVDGVSLVADGGRMCASVGGYPLPQTKVPEPKK